jgi:hypothetical protein
MSKTAANSLEDLVRMTCEVGVAAYSGSRGLRDKKSPASAGLFL